MHVVCSDGTSSTSPCKLGGGPPSVAQSRTRGVAARGRAHGQRTAGVIKTPSAREPNGNPLRRAKALHGCGVGLRAIPRTSPARRDGGLIPQDADGCALSANRQKGCLASGYQPICGFAIMSQKIASTAAKAGKPKANHHQNSL